MPGGVQHLPLPPEGAGGPTELTPPAHLIGEVGWLLVWEVLSRELPSFCCMSVLVLSSGCSTTGAYKVRTGGSIPLLGPSCLAVF